MGIPPTALAPEAESHNSLNSVSVRVRLIQSFSERTDCAFDPIGVVRQFHLTVEFCGQIPLDQSGAEPHALGRQNGGALPLAPAQAKLVILRMRRQGPGDHARRGRNRIRAKGPEVTLGVKPALAFGLALHELGTNAAKYGALSNAEGCKVQECRR
jgi:hypothetical protein